MRIAYFDCFSGVSGDMILGACLGAGLELEVLRQDLAGLKVPGYTLSAKPVRRHDLAAVQFEVQVDPATDQQHRHLRHIRAIIESSRLSPGVRERALAIFTRLAQAEADAHATDIEKVHFHEIGAVDSIVDIVGACVAFERLGIERVHCSPIPTGSGTVQCDHGLLPVPTPATVALLVGVPLADCDEPGELTTPTGAAILTTVAQEFGPLPGMRLERVGVGAGHRQGQHRANVLRVLIGEAVEAAGGDEADEVIVLEANLDDVSGEVIGYVYERLFAAGALDVYATPVYMKKNRPGTLLTVLAAPDRQEAITDVLLAETTTLGVRTYSARRRKLARSSETVQTELGPIRVKVAWRGGQAVKAAPEFDDCSAAARRTGRPLREVMDLAIRAWDERHGPPAQ